MKNDESVDGVVKEVTEEQLVFENLKTVYLDQIENYFLIDGNGKDLSKH